MKLGLCAPLLVAVLFVSFSCASGTSIVLVYDRSGREGLARGLAEILQPMFPDSEVWILDDPERFNSIAFLPQVKLLVLLQNIQELSLNAEAVEWFFRSGGSVLGNFFAGVEESSGNMARDVFPIYANATTTATFNKGTRRYEMVYLAKDKHQITDGLPSRFVTLEGRMVIRWNPSIREPVRILPATGTVSDLYVEESNGFPLVVAYEEQGQSVFFSSLDPPSNLSRLLHDANYSNLLSNVAGWLVRADRKSSRYDAGALKQAFSTLLEERVAASEAAYTIRRNQGYFKLGLDALVVGVSGFGIRLVYRFLIRPGRTESIR